MIGKPRRLLSLWMSLLALTLWVGAPVAGEEALEPKDPADAILEDVSPRPKAPVAATPRPHTPKRLTPREAARLRAKLRAVTKTMYRDAKTFFWQDDWDRCITQCDEILKRDPSYLKAQKLKYQSERAKLDHKLKMLEQVGKLRDDEAIVDLDKASMFPEKKPPLTRPVRSPLILPLPVRVGKPVKSAKMLEMEQKLNQRVDLNLLDVDLAFLFSTLHRISGVNIIADEESLGGDEEGTPKRLKILVEDMPLKEILRFVVRKYPDIAYTVTENAVWITQIDSGGEHPGMEPRIHPLNCGLVVITPMKTSAKSTRGRRPTPPGGAPPGGAPDDDESKLTSLEEVLTWMSGWPDWPGGSTYSIDKTNSSLMVYTTPEMHDKISNMLELVDRPPIQVLISTRFITISIDNLAELGLDFSLNTKPGQDIALGAGSGTNLGTSGIAGGLTAIVKGQDTDPLFTATLRALEQKGRAKVLSAPQIITLNNQKGVIDLSTKFSYQEEWVEIKTVDVVGDSGNTVERVTSFKPRMNRNGETGFKLFVTPSVGRNLKHIVLEVEPIIKDLEGELSRFSETQIIVLSEDESPPAIPQPIVHEQTLRTRMVLEDGGLLVIGGLLSQDTEKTVTKVPILGDIPILGLLFRRTQDTVKKSHMVIVVKAQIIDPSGRAYVDNVGAMDGASANGGRPAKGPWFGYPEPGETVGTAR